MAAICHVYVCRSCLPEGPCTTGRASQISCLAVLRSEHDSDNVQGGTANVLDLTEEEEAACGSSGLHVAVNAKGSVYSVSKGGSTAVQPGRLVVRLYGCCCTPLCSL